MKFDELGQYLDEAGVTEADLNTVFDAELRDGELISGKDPEVDKALARIVGAFTGWDENKLGVGPIQRVDTAWSAGFLLIVADVEEPYALFGGIAEEGDKMIPETGPLRMPAGFNTKLGYASVRSHAEDMLQKFNGVTLDHLKAVLFGPEIRTEYPRGGPLGAREDPNRWAFTYVAYIKEEAVEMLLPLAGLSHIVRITHATFMSEYAKLSNGEDSRLSRFPQQAAEFAKIWPDSWLAWNMNGARFTFDTGELGYPRQLG